MLIKSLIPSWFSFLEKLLRFSLFHKVPEFQEDLIILLQIPWILSIWKHSVVSGIYINHIHCSFFLFLLSQSFCCVFLIDLLGTYFFKHLPLLCQFFQLVNIYFAVIFLYSNNSAYFWPLYHYSWSCFMYVISSWVFLRLMIRMFKNVSFVLEWPLLSSS